MQSDDPLFPLAAFLPLASVDAANAAGTIRWTSYGGNVKEMDGTDYVDDTPDGGV